MAGLARLVLYRRARLVLLEPFELGILATTLRYQYEVRDAAPYFEDIPKLTIPVEMKDLAGHIIETKRTEFDPAKFGDRYENAVVALVQAKQAGAPVPAPRKEPHPSNVVNLMDALRRSVEAEAGATRKKPASGTALKGKRRLKKAG